MTISDCALSSLSSLRSFGSSKIRAADSLSSTAIAARPASLSTPRFLASAAITSGSIASSRTREISCSPFPEASRILPRSAGSSFIVVPFARRDTIDERVEGDRALALERLRGGLGRLSDSYRVDQDELVLSQRVAGDLAEIRRIDGAHAPPLHLL